MRPRGFALVELLVALVLSGIIGIALVRLVVVQARFTSSQDGLMQARSTARAALNVLNEELRMVSEGGLVAANRDSVTLRVPYAFAVACLQFSGWRIAALLPADSAQYASAQPSGYAWRNAVGRWNFVEPVGVAGVSPLFCQAPFTMPGVNVISAPGWSGRAVVINPNAAGMQVGTPFYLYQRVTYVFAPSATISGTRALWRAVPGAGLRDELVAPFDTATRFSFLTGDTLGVVSAAPASLDSVRGVDVRLVALSNKPPEGRTARVQFDVTSSIVFRGRAP
jgi:prepilin-type N-terminal cleavage/methylation domain-containing protein